MATYSVTKYILLPALQEQYIFIHDAILEALTCGDTQIDAGVFSKKIKEMSYHNSESHLTEYENQFRVSITIIATVYVFFQIPYRYLRRYHLNHGRYHRTKLFEILPKTVTTTTFPVCDQCISNNTSALLYALLQVMNGVWF